MKHRTIPCLSALVAALALSIQPVQAVQPGARHSDAILLAQNQSPQRPPDVPYVPTTPEVVAEMLRLGQVDKNDLVYDLGSGDGRIVITAAKKYGARGVGVDIDPNRVREAKENAQKEGVTDKVKFVQQDLFNTDLHDATVVTLYLLPSVNMKLRPKLLSELKPGTKVVSHNYDMGDWKPDQTVQLGSHTIYVWTVPEKGQGTATKQ
ncbi:MAG TPA: class I SAM-dependent methyltransferase [Burkholderiales bacterium]|nr:class I SAM-dependent methyltransferase [Burkholderiales bacterium]